MTLISTHLPEVWYGIIGFLLLYYAVADGYDLGIGMLSLFAKDDAERGLMMSAIKDNWHANQTWLVLLSGMLFGAFPRLYSLVLSTLYFPLLLMLVGLMTRGIALEFRDGSPHKSLWGFLFGIGSVIAAVTQGLTLGTLLWGLDEHPVSLNPFALLTAVGVTAGYVMLGSSYLILKTTGPVQRCAFASTRWASLATLCLSCAVYAGVVMRYPFIRTKWLQHPVWLSIAPLIAIAALCLYLITLKKRLESVPLVLNIIFVLAGFLGLSIGFYPYILPNVVLSPMTIRSAAASSYTLSFMLIATIVVLPVILIYSAYKLWTFRGKAELQEYDD